MTLPVSPFRCFVDQPLNPGPLELLAEESLHLARVRRVGLQAEVTVLNGQGQLGQAKVTVLDKRSVELQVEQVLQLDQPAAELILAVGALKPAAWEEMMVHAVELGVSRLIRVETMHAVSGWEPEREEGKIRRWREKMIQACKQSANPWLPELTGSRSLSEAVETLPDAATHLLADMTTSQRMNEAVRNPSGDVVVWVGPEGDFTAEERAFLRDRVGAIPVSLGPRILRSETAALAMVAALRLGSGEPLHDIADPGSALENIG